MSVYDHQHDPYLGLEILGQFRIECKIGQGGMGAVYLADQPSMSRKVAVKILRSEIANNPELAERFGREARALANLDHPHIVKVFNYQQLEDGSLALVMEYVKGQSLDSLLEETPKLEWSRAVEIARQAAEALEEAHTVGILHRDIKPGNIFLVPGRRKEDLVKVLDFGIAKVMDEIGGQFSGKMGVLHGTPMYMSPEQARGEKVGFRSDIYSLGICLYVMLAGRLPFNSETLVGYIMAHQHTAPAPLADFASGYPPQLETILARMLAKKPIDRYQSMQQVADELGKLLLQKEIAANSSGEFAVPAHTGSTNPAIVQAAPPASDTTTTAGTTIGATTSTAPAPSPDIKHTESSDATNTHPQGGTEQGPTSATAPLSPSDPPTIGVAHTKGTASNLPDKRPPGRRKRNRRRRWLAVTITIILVGVPAAMGLVTLLRTAPTPNVPSQSIAPPDRHNKVAPPEASHPANSLPGTAQVGNSPLKMAENADTSRVQVLEQSDTPPPAWTKAVPFSMDRSFFMGSGKGATRSIAEENSALDARIKIFQALIKNAHDMEAAQLVKKIMDERGNAYNGNEDRMRTAIGACQVLEPQIDDTYWERIIPEPGQAPQFRHMTLLTVNDAHMLSARNQMFSITTASNGTRVIPFCPLLAPIYGESNGVIVVTGHKASTDGKDVAGQSSPTGLNHSLSAGDMIFEIEGQKISSVPQVMSIIKGAKNKQHRSVTVQIKRIKNGVAKAETITLPL